MQFRNSLFALQCQLQHNVVDTAVLPGLMGLGP